MKKLNNKKNLQRNKLKENLINLWINEELVKPSTRGFIYLIVNTKDKKLYVGKKKAISETRVKVAGRVNRKRVIKPSNWKSYYGSCKPLLADIKRHGKENFTRYILGAYSELHTVNYGEAELQFLMHVLDEDPQGYSWYNKNIKITAMRPPADREYVRRLNEILKELK